jgi:bisphosphoglycerate-independent phosphoglycerate mutase (AlkP superfamily)
MGLVSDGEFTRISTISSLTNICRKNYKGKIAIHAFTGKRDVDPKVDCDFFKT